MIYKQNTINDLLIVALRFYYTLRNFGPFFVSPCRLRFLLECPNIPSDPRRPLKACWIKANAYESAIQSSGLLGSDSGELLRNLGYLTYLSLRRCPSAVGIDPKQGIVHLPSCHVPRLLKPPIYSFDLHGTHPRTPRSQRNVRLTPRRSAQGPLRPRPPAPGGAQGRSRAVPGPHANGAPTMRFGTHSKWRIFAARRLHE